MTRPATRRSRLSAEERKASIVAAATGVFAEAGYQRGTMSEVARRVGVSEPVVFQNFGSKAAVFAAVLEEAAARVTAGMRERVDATGSVGAWLAELLGPGHLGHVHARDPHDVLFADAMSQVTEPVVAEAIRRAHRAVAQTLVDLLARGQAEGDVRRDLDPETGAWWLLSMFASRGILTAAMPDSRRHEVQLGALTLEALTGRAPSSRGA